MQSWLERSRAGAASPAQLATKGWYPWGRLDQRKPLSTASRRKTVDLDARRPPPNQKDGQLRRAQDLSPGRGRGGGDPKAVISVPPCPGLPLWCSSVGYSAGL